MAASIAVKTGDKIFVEALDCVPIRKGSGWILEYFRNPKVKEVAVDGANGQKILTDLMVSQGYKAPYLPKVAEIITANAMFEQGIVSQNICHTGQTSLRAVITNCEKRPIGSNGGYGFKSMSDTYDIALMDSAILAYWLAATAKEEAPQSIDY